VTLTSETLSSAPSAAILCFCDFAIVCGTSDGRSPAREFEIRVVWRAGKVSRPARTTDPRQTRQLPLQGLESRLLQQPVAKAPRLIRQSAGTR
jgi:hypothetical protein